MDHDDPGMRPPRFKVLPVQVRKIGGVGGHDDAPLRCAVGQLCLIVLFEYAGVGGSLDVDAAQAQRTNGASVHRVFIEIVDTSNGTPRISTPSCRSSVMRRAPRPARPNNADRTDQPSYPKKHPAAGALFFNRAGALLLVKPTYREYWSIPGGIVEENDSPRQACVREVREEMELDVPVERLLAIDCMSLATGARESLQFLFYGGTLTDTAMARITLPPAELSAFHFSPVAEALTLLNPPLARRLPHALAAIDAAGAAYLEDGAVANGAR